MYGDVYPGKREPTTITLDPAYVNRLLGLEIPVEEMVRILTSLEFKVESAKPIPELGLGLSSSARRRPSCG